MGERLRHSLLPCWAVGLAAVLLWGAIPPRPAVAKEGEDAGKETADVPEADVEKPQVRIEARVLEWQTFNDRQVDFAVRFNPTGPGTIVEGADLTLPANPSLGSAARVFLSGMDSAGGSFESVIETLEVAGDVEVLHRPSIVLTSKQFEEAKLNNADDLKMNKKNEVESGYWEARVSNSVRIPYETAAASGSNLISFTEYKNSGVTLEVTVLKVIDDLVVLDLRTTVAELTGFIRVGLNKNNEPMQVPTLDTRIIQNRLIIPNRTVFLGGLMKTSRQSSRRRGVPFLSELPLVGTLLSSHRNTREDTELVFLLKPEILQDRNTLAEIAQGDESE